MDKIQLYLKVVADSDKPKYSRDSSALLSSLPSQFIVLAPRIT